MHCMAVMVMFVVVFMLVFCVSMLFMIVLFMIMFIVIMFIVIMFIVIMVIMAVVVIMIRLWITGFHIQQLAVLDGYQRQIQFGFQVLHGSPLLIVGGLAFKPDQVGHWAIQLYQHLITVLRQRQFRDSVLMSRCSLRSHRRGAQ